VLSNSVVAQRLATLEAKPLGNYGILSQLNIEPLNPNETSDKARASWPVKRRHQKRELGETQSTKLCRAGAGVCSTK